MTAQRFTFAPPVELELWTKGCHDPPHNRCAGAGPDVCAHMIEDIEDYFDKGCGRCARFSTPQCSVRKWEPGLRILRDLCREAGLHETVKWGHPCYVHADRNIAIIGAFQDNFCITFFNAALMKDPKGLLEKAGPNTQQPSVVRFTDNVAAKKLQPVLRSYLLEAMAYAEQGRLPTKVKTSFELPDELVDTFDADPELAEAFHKLTPGRQRSYVINLSSAKTSATRLSRISKFRSVIISGKGANER
jgi:uncharacterized protein YdeI (YjbR/CyaY-like superfamily)